jgi:hypothetical protein
LECCCTSPLDEFTLATLTPDAEGFAKDWWPNLRKMGYTPKSAEV